MKLLFTTAFSCFASIVFCQPFLVGDRVDVHATDAKYYAATVAESSNHQLKVRYLGYGADKDAWVKEADVVRGGAIGDKIIVIAASGTFYGTVTEVSTNGYKVRYDGYPDIYPLTRTQFSFVSSAAESRKNNALNNQVAAVKPTPVRTQEAPAATAMQNGIYPVGTKLMGLEGTSWYAATVLEYANGKYRVKWDNYNYEAMLTPAQVKATPTLPQDKIRPTNGKLYLRSIYWIATGNTERSWFFLGDNGVIVINPVSGTNPVNPAVEQARNFLNVGQYSMGKSSVDVKWLNGKSTSYSMKMQNGEIIELDAGGIMVRQRGMPDNYKLNGTYKGSLSIGGVSSSGTYNFRNDGSVTVSQVGTAAHGRAENNRQGSYVIKGNNLLISFNDGSQVKANIGMATGNGNNNIVIDNTWFTKL